MSIGDIKGTDENYIYDLESLEKLGILQCDEEYWLGSREFLPGNLEDCAVRCVSSIKGLGKKYLATLDESGEQGGSCSATCYLRPVFTLINEIEISGGIGSKESPYKLKY